jgi:hypothetical protein
MGSGGDKLHPYARLPYAAEKFGKESENFFLTTEARGLSYLKK